MFCSSCGVAVAQGLSFCNYCGAKLDRSSGDAKAAEVRPETLVAATVMVFVFGLGAITLLMAVMRALLRFEVGQTLAFAFLSFLIMLLLEGVFISLLLRGRSKSKKTLDQQSAEPVTNELEAAHARVLPEPRSSVTDHTTRSFEPLLREQQSK